MGEGRTLGQVEACRHRAYVGILAVFLLAFCLLGVDDAIAQEHLKLQLTDYYPAGPNDYTGRLEIYDANYGPYSSGEWRWICDDNFGEQEAKVACKELGLPTDGAAVWEMPDGWLSTEGLSGSIAFLVAIKITNISSVSAILDDVDCDGDESKLIDCTHAGLGVSDCEISEAVGVACPGE